MLTKRVYGKILFYFIFFILITFLIKSPLIHLSLKDASVISLVVLWIHSLIDKRYLLSKLSQKFNNQKSLINNLFINCPNLIYLKDNNFNYIDCNPQMKKLICIDGNTDIAGKNDFDIFPTETAETLRQYDKKVIEKGEIVSYKIEKKFFTGETKIYDTILAPTINKEKISGVLGIMRDITQTEALREKYLIKNAQLNSILDNVPFVIYLKDIEGRVIACNKILEDYIKQPVKNIIGKNLSEMFLQDIAEKIKKEDAQIIKDKKKISYESNLNIFGKEKSWYSVSKSPIFNDDNEVIGIIVYFINIDDEKKLQARKETFVATLTHDLKTPTTAQMNAMKLLLNGSLGPLNPQQSEMVELSLNSNIYMSNMISTILATYKSESGEVLLKPEQFDITELISATCKEICNLARTKDQNIIVKSSIDNPLITADKLQLKRAVVNLISNAITYGFDKTDIEVLLREEDNRIFLDVLNHCRYIPPERMKEIFLKYKSSENAKFNKASTGLGLYLSKQIINAHSGEIHANSYENQTCIFGFSIPRVQKPVPEESGVN